MAAVAQGQPRNLGSSGALPQQLWPRNPASSSLQISCPRPFQFNTRRKKGVHFHRDGKSREAFPVVLASSVRNSSSCAESRRKVVEHICLLKAKEGLSDEEEKDMLDYLYTSQYHMGGIVAISLGRTSDQNKDYTHAVYMRFQRKEDLAIFYDNPLYSQVLKEHVFPHCHELLYVDFESEVQDDMLLIFRKGEEFNAGVEFVLLIEFLESALGGPAEDALVSLEKLITEFPTLIVQSTQGCNFNSSNKDYTHGVVIRFRSVDAFEIFMTSREYKRIWSSKFHPICRKTLSVHFSVDPIGNQIMHLKNCHLVVLLPSKIHICMGCFNTVAYMSAELTVTQPDRTCLRLNCQGREASPIRGHRYQSQCENNNREKRS